MSDQTKDDEVRAAYKKLSKMRGECPDSDQLVRYQQHALSTEDMLLIKQHLSLCGLCDWAVTGLAEFDSVASPNVQKQRQSARKGSLLRYILHPALAYGIVLALLIPAYQGIFHKRSTIEKKMHGVVSARDFDLGNGSTTRSASSVDKKLILLSPLERFFILSIFVPIRKDYKYEMEILNQKGETVDSGEIVSRDALGNFSIVANSNLFPDDDYSLIVKEVDQQTRKVKDEYRFVFRVERQRS
ncbi:MAG TPA: hypothetical protein VLH08_15305 [Acidobacteriota bacterium]|nr:hypothetical protein [Acidobacteriota bacterium]